MIRFEEVHLEIRDMVAEFSRNELTTRAERVDDGPEFPEKSLGMLGELGLLGAPLPEAYGGSDGDLRLVSLILEELAYGCASTALVVSSHLATGLAILESGNDSQREQWLSSLAGGSLIASSAVGEPDIECPKNLGSS